MKDGEKENSREVRPRIIRTCEFSMNNEKLEKIIDKTRTDQKELIHILHDVQSEYGYIPPEAVTAISRRLKISESEIFGVLTFYNA